MIPVILTTPADLQAATALEATALDAEPEIRNLVDETATSFMMEHKAPLRFARRALPGNRLLGNSQATTFVQFENLLRNESDSRASGAANIATGIIAAGAGIVAGGAIAYISMEIFTSLPYDLLDKVATLVAAIIGGGLAALAMLSIIATVAGGRATGEVTFKTMAPKFKKLFTEVITGLNASQLNEVQIFLTDETNRLQFFRENPEAAVTFLTGTLSSAFRQKEAEAQTRIDMLTLEREAKQKRLKDREEEIKTSDYPEATQESLLATVQKAAKKGFPKLDKAIVEEEEFKKKLDGIVKDVLAVAAEISREVEKKNVVEGVADFVAEMEEIDETVARAERARIQAVIDLAEHWKRLRKIGDEVIHIAQAHHELSLQLLNPPSK